MPDMSEGIEPTADASLAPGQRGTSHQHGTSRQRGSWLGLAAFAAIIAFAGAYLFFRPPTDPPEGFAKANGRIEGERLDIAAKYPGRLKELLVKEGDAVALDQVLARMDTAELDAQLHEAEASVRQSERQLDQAIALLAQRKSELALSGQQLERSQKLVEKGYATQEVIDNRRAAKNTAEAAESSAQAQISVMRASIDAGIARVERIKTMLDDSVLKAPRAGRVQYRLALPGEVLPAGGKILTLLDLTDVYMTVFLPTKEAGRLALGSDARLIFDAAPQYVVPATVSFVAADAQFTPKYVETKSEREKLMFRVKVQIPKEVLEKYADTVKTGVPGVAYVKLSHSAVWPQRLVVKLPR